jgi:hypothetical protein
MTYFCTTHKDEDLNALIGEKLDMCTSHMVADSFYDIEQYQLAPRPNHVVWVMEKDTTAKFGYRFKTLYGIPR